MESCTSYFIKNYSFDMYLKEVFKHLNCGTHTSLLHVAQTTNPSNCYIFKRYVVHLHLIKVK